MEIRNDLPNRSGSERETELANEKGRTHARTAQVSLNNIALRCGQLCVLKRICVGRFRMERFVGVSIESIDRSRFLSLLLLATVKVQQFHVGLCSKKD